MPDFTAVEWRLGPLAAGLLVFFLWESLAPYLEQRRRGVHAARNLTLAGCNAVLVGLCCAAATVGVAAWTDARGWGLLNQIALPGWARLALGVLLLDLWTYWWHRANHRVALLWRFHRTHHSDPSMDVSTALRFHGGELLASAALRLALIPLLGLSLAAVALYGLLVVLCTQFHHANIGLRRGLDRALRTLIVSPDMHKVHHSEIVAETDSNYSTLFSWWDRLFGTYREREDCREIRFGVTELGEERFQTLAGLALTPFRSTARR